MHGRLSMRLAYLMVGGALFAGTLLAIDLGLARASHSWLVPAFVTGLVCVVVGEFLSWHNAASAWHERRPGSLVLWCILGSILSCGTLWTNFSTSAANQNEKSSLQKAQFVAFENVGDRLAEAKSDLKRVADRLAWMQTAVNGKPVRSVEAAQASIDNAHAHKYWEATNHCSETHGAQTRAFCADHAGYIAEKALAGEKKVLEAELASAKASVAKYDDKAAHTQAVVSDDTPGVTALRKWASFDGETARQADSMTLPLLVQAMLVLGGILLANETYRDRQRLKWFDWQRWKGVAKQAGAHIAGTKTEASALSQNSTPHIAPPVASVPHLVPAAYDTASAQRLDLNMIAPQIQPVENRHVHRLEINVNGQAVAQPAAAASSQVVNLSQPIGEGVNSPNYHKPKYY
jgi:hypothetical protein